MTWFAFCVGSAAGFLAGLLVAAILKGK